MPNFVKQFSKINIVFFSGILKNKYNFKMPVTGFKKIGFNQCSNFLFNYKPNFKKITSNKYQED